jgi:NTE family protein
MLFAAYFFDFIFQHFDDVNVLVSCNKVEKQTIAHPIFIIVKTYGCISIAGCSMGALIGGVYAAGKLKEFREWMKTIDRKKMLELTDFSFSLNHIVKGTRIIEAIMEFVPDVAIEELPIPYCAVATDWKAGSEVVFNSGSLFEAIRASISLPSFY